MAVIADSFSCYFVRASGKIYFLLRLPSLELATLDGFGVHSRAELEILHPFDWPSTRHLRFARDRSSCRFPQEKFDHHCWSALSADSRSIGHVPLYLPTRRLRPPRIDNTIFYKSCRRQEIKEIIIPVQSISSSHTTATFDNRFQSISNERRTSSVALPFPKPRGRYQTVP